MQQYVFCCSALFLSSFFVTTVHERPESNLRPAAWRCSAKEKETQLDVFPYRALQRGTLLPLKEGTTFGEAGGADAVSPELPAQRDIRQVTQSRIVEHTGRGARFGKEVGERSGGPMAATVAESSGGCTGTPNEATEKPAEAKTVCVLR